VPFDTPEREALFRVGKGVVEAVGGFRGYLGVDLVMAGDEVVVVDLNPRLTTSYIGLRRVINLNPAGAMLNAVFEGRLPAAVETAGYAVFSKLRISSATPKRVLERISQLEEVVSPPLPPASDTELYAIGLTCAPTL
jgi:predicted ATP-grasp superfamily ATP-dependent carboligase